MPKDALASLHILTFHHDLFAFRACKHSFVTQVCMCCFPLGSAHQRLCARVFLKGGITHCVKLCHQEEQRYHHNTTSCVIAMKMRNQDTKQQRPCSGMRCLKPLICGYNNFICRWTYVFVDASPLLLSGTFLASK